MKLYELSSAYRQLEAAVDDESEDADLLALLEQISGELREKAVNVAKVLQNLESDAKAIKEAAKRMSDRARAAEGRASRMRDYLLQNMLGSGIHSIECDHFVLKVRDNPEAVVIDDATKIPAEYLRQPPPEPDKRSILADIKHGVVIDGVHTERGKRLEIR